HLALHGFSEQGAHHATPQSFSHTRTASAAPNDDHRVWIVVAVVVVVVAVMAVLSFTSYPFPTRKAEPEAEQQRWTPPATWACSRPVNWNEIREHKYQEY